MDLSDTRINMLNKFGTREIRTMRTKRGFGILKEAFEPKELASIKKELTVKPFVPPGMGKKPVPFTVFLESPKRLWLPDVWATQKFGEPQIDKVNTDVEDCREHLKFKGDLREYQHNLLQKWKDIVHKGRGGGILSVPCGYGKTVMSIYAACLTGKKTLIVVHKEFLMNQFKDEIKRFCPTARIGKLQGNTIDIENKDIVIAMLQSITIKN